MGNDNSIISNIFTDTNYTKSIESALTFFYKNNYVIYRDNKSYYIIYNLKIYRIKTTYKSKNQKYETKMIQCKHFNSSCNCLENQSKINLNGILNIVELE